MNSKTKYLSQKERETARKYFFRYVGFNGVGFSFLGNTTVYLLAILYGASNLQLGYISSVLYITGIFLIFYPRLFRGKSTKTVGYWAWQLRGLVCLAYLLLPLLSGSAAVWLILVTYTLFCITRTIGVALQQSIQKMISSSRTRGEVIMTASTRFNSISLMSRFFSFVVTSVHLASDLTNILFLQLLGIISNAFASLNLKRMPNREVVDYTPGEHMGKLFMKTMKQKQNRTVLLLRWGAISIEILTAMTIPFLRQFAGFSASEIFLYTLIITLAAIFAALFVRPFADRLGSRPFILPSAILMGLIYLAWMTVVPGRRSPEFFYILGFVTVFIQNILSLLSSRLFIQSIPDEGSVSYTSMDVVVTSILALMLGFLAGGLADLSARSGTLPFLNVYGLTFSLALVVCTGITVTAAGFYEKGSATLKKTWTMIFSIEHMRTFRDISRLEAGNSSHKRKTLILSLAYTGSSLANEEIRQIFRNPVSSEKADIMRTLFERKRPELVPDLIREAGDPYSLYRQQAIFALGAYPEPDVEEALSGLLDDRDGLTVSNAAKSLGRIGSRVKRDEIRERFIREERGHVEKDLNYIIALYNMDPGGLWLEQIFNSGQARLGESYEQTIFTLVSRQRDWKPPLGWIYQMNNLTPAEGMTILLDETRESTIFFNAHARLAASYECGDYKDIWSWCREVLGDPDRYDGAAQPIARSICAFDLTLASASNTIAALYFTYQILSEGGDL